MITDEDYHDWVRLGERGLLSSVPRNRWHDITRHGFTLLHIASYSGDERATVHLISEGLNLDAFDQDGYTPASHAAIRDNVNILRILAASGANLRLCYFDGLYRSWQCVLFLVANGVRLSSHYKNPSHLPLDLIDFERGVLRCRSVVCILIRILPCVAREIWATREDKKWRPYSF